VIPSALALLDVGPIEMLVVAIAAIMLFGGDLPDIARRAGQIVGKLRSAATDLTREIDMPSDLNRLPDPDDSIHHPPPAPTTPPPPAPPTPPSPSAPEVDQPPPPPT
jgi:sec-independent protein translocase protein TatA